MKRAMKKITALTISIAVIITFAPVFSMNSEAASSSVGSTVKLKKTASMRIPELGKTGEKGKAGEKKVSGYIYHNGIFSKIVTEQDTLSLYKQVILENLDQELNGSITDNSGDLIDQGFAGGEILYAPFVWDKIQEEYTSFVDSVNSAQKLSDIISEQGELLVVNPKISNKEFVLTKLMKYPREKLQKLSQVTSGKNSLKGRYTAKFNRIWKKGFKRSDYSAYYWGQIQDAEKEARKDIAKIKDLESYILISESLDQFLKNEFPDLVESEEDEEDIIISDTGTQLAGESFYTKEALKDAKKQQYEYMKESVNQLYKNKWITKTEKKSAAKIISGFMKKINKDPDGDNVLRAYDDDFSRKLEQNFHIAERMTKNALPEADLIRWKKTMTAYLYQHYDFSKYSAAGRDRLQSAVSGEFDALSGTRFSQKSLDAATARAKKAMKKVPTKKQKNSQKKKK